MSFAPSPLRPLCPLWFKLLESKGSSLLILLLINALVAGMLLPLFLGEELYARRTSTKSSLIKKIASSNTELSEGMMALQHNRPLPPSLELLPLSGSSEAHLLETKKFSGKGVLLALSSGQFIPNWDLLLSSPSLCSKHTLHKKPAKGESAILCQQVSATIRENSSVRGNLSADKLIFSPIRKKHLVFATKGSFSVRQLELNFTNNSSIEIISRGDIEIESLTFSGTSPSNSLRIHSRQGRIRIGNYPPELYLGQGTLAADGIRTSLESSLGAKLGKKQFGKIAGCTLPRDKLLWESLQILGKTPLI